ncbi:YhcN/YlaJ family sporulation lipoprotein [Bacillus sp. FJAT-27245]|uniref:YhcN/YlaJ family sporulation lipoprotein n=1 Tax=Bacillus sp. FJAT-27245 TaxID=1684144 RepID=UPI0006A7E697|nr:YhcN/YlaJ family sporulation lipoprotein [Bacillus sp. FJAT-27245]
MDKLLIIVIILLVITDCGANGRPDVGKDSKQLVQVKNSAAPNPDRKAGQRAASHLEQIASSVPKVNGANAVVLGKYAIVGIDIDSTVERSEAGTIKYSVAEALKDDPYGARAMVIADPDMNARLREISADIEGGRPVQGILYELADLAGRIVPEMPGKIIEPERGRPVKEQKEKMPKQDKEKLERRQEEESLRRK